jgi:NAD(P)-dependent dehydrogenase (short-subunit alcohol dehydrogenase family)
MNRFVGKTVIITGAAGGIGQQLCRCFCDEGASVGAIDRSEKLGEFAEELSRSGHRIASIIGDIGNPQDMKSAFRSLQKDLGPCDVLINNAGYSGAATLDSTTEDIWSSDLNGNLNGAYFCARNVIDGMKSKGGGAIVNIGSVNGNAAFGDPAYSAAKAGLTSLTRSLAMEYGRFGIRANIICPGTVRTPIWDHRIAKNPEIFEQLVRWYPLRRVADPIDIAKAALFLASDDAAAISGAMLPVDCGLSAGNIVMTRELTVSDL